MLLGATHGSADGYFAKEEFQKLQASRKSLAFPEQGGDHGLVISVLDLPEERQLFEKQIMPLQENYLHSIVPSQWHIAVLQNNHPTCYGSQNITREWFSNQAKKK
jgi:hypothetical protein